MKNYLPVDFDNLDSVQESVLKFFPEDKLRGQSLFYIDDNITKFLSISTLRDNLDRLNITRYISCIGFYIIPTTSITGTIKHIDHSNSTYSLNVPVAGCNNTWVNFYESSVEPVLKYNNSGVPYYHCDQSACYLTDRFEMTSPHVINVKTIHNVLNRNIRPRITLLIRLTEGWNPDMLSVTSYNPR